MKIDRRLFLVQKIIGDGTTFHIHSTPISREVWSTYFEVLSQVYTKLFMGGMAASTGPGVAALMLKKFAVQNNEWDGPEGVNEGLMSEIRRLTNVVIATGSGWETIPYEAALSRGLIDQDAQSEAENAIVFFICVSSVLRGPASRDKLSIILAIMSRLWEHAQISSLDITAYAASLATLTQEEPIIQKAVSSVPY